MSTKNKLITYTGSNKKVIINLELAKQVLPLDSHYRLMAIINELKEIQKEET